MNAPGATLTVATSAAGARLAADPGGRFYVLARPIGGYVTAEPVLARQLIERGYIVITIVGATSPERGHA